MSRSKAIALLKRRHAWLVTWVIEHPMDAGIDFDKAEIAALGLALEALEVRVQ